MQPAELAPGLPPSRSPVAQSGENAESGDEAGTLLRALVKERHWQNFDRFRVQFERAAREIAERDGDPEIAKTTVSDRQSQRWYAGNMKTGPHPDACRVLEYMFGYPVQRLLAPASAASDSAAQETAPPVAGTGVAVPDQSHDPVPKPPAGPAFPLSADAMAAEISLDPRDSHEVARISEALPYYARTAALLGGRPLVNLAEKYVKVLCSGCEATHGKYRDQILAACARYAEFLGWLHQDLGNPVLSLFWTDRAMEWAMEAGTDQQFESYVLMRKADHAEQYGTAGRVIALARSALRITPLSPRAQALAVQQEARGYSQNGEQSLFECKLDEARELIAKSGNGEDAPWGEYCDITHIAMQEASGWIELRQFGKAIDIIETNFPRMSGSARVDSAVYRARLARAYAEAGYPDRAAEIGLAACPDASATESARAYAELQQANQILTASKHVPLAVSFAASFTSLAGKFAMTTRQVQ